MKRTALLLAAALAAASAASPALAEGVVRPGDASLSCEALASEIGSLEEAQLKRAKRAESGRKFMGFAGAAFSAAAPSLLGRAGGGEGAMIAQSLLGSMQANAARPPQAAPEPAADTSPEAQRLDLLKAMRVERSC